MRTTPLGLCASAILLRNSPTHRPIKGEYRIDLLPKGRKPITGIAACCAHTASGHTAAAPPSAASNSRRLMMTVIRPSRARCVKGTIPHQERAVFILKEGRIPVAQGRRHRQGGARQVLIRDK